MRCGPVRGSEKLRMEIDLANIVIFIKGRKFLETKRGRERIEREKIREKEREDRKRKNQRERERKKIFFLGK